VTPDTVLVKSTLYVGTVKVQCPADKCYFMHKFTDTTETVRTNLKTLERRLEYLRRCHEAGLHRSRII
jgi:hypothetical protein